MAINTGVIQLYAATENPGFYCYVKAEVYYNPNNQNIRNVQGAALRVWNTCPGQTNVLVTNNVLGTTETVAIPGGGDDVTPVLTKTAAELSLWGITKRSDVTYSIAVA